MKVPTLGLLLLCVACGPQNGTRAGASAQAGDSVPAASLQQQRLARAANILLPPEGFVAESLPEPGSRGAQLLVTYCAQCHALPSPASHGVVDWTRVMQRMWVRMDMLRGELGLIVPEEGDRVVLLDYINRHALQVTEQLPAGAGRELFARSCSRCHTLADPRAHTAADWPVVVVRMERNMERMRVRGLPPEEFQQIVRYLQGASARASR